MDQGPSVAQSYGKVLKTHREHLVAHISNTQCLLDNLLENGYFTTEDVEIVGAYATKPSQVRGQVAGVRGQGQGEALTKADAALTKALSYMPRCHPASDLGAHMRANVSSLSACLATGGDTQTFISRLSAKGKAV